MQETQDLVVPVISPNDQGALSAGWLAGAHDNIT